jgi:hypothetical protein
MCYCPIQGLVPEGTVGVVLEGGFCQRTLVDAEAVWV